MLSCLHFFVQLCRQSLVACALALVRVFLPLFLIAQVIGQCSVEQRLHHDALGSIQDRQDFCIGSALLHVFHDALGSIQDRQDF